MYHGGKAMAKVVFTNPAVQAIMDSLPQRPNAAKRQKANAMQKRAVAMISGIVPGQPVLSARDATLRAKSSDLMFQSAAILKEIGDL